MKACGSDAYNQGRGAPCSAGCDDVLSAQAEGARMCGAWPYTGTPSIPGPLTEAELDQRNAEMQARYMQGMRALSKEEMEQRMLEQARGMMNVYPQAFYGNATQAAMRNASAYSVTISTAGSGGGGVEPELDGPYRPTWRQKLRAFWDAVRFG